MKYLKTSNATLGPFAVVEQLEDRWRCDGVDYPFAVIGEATVEGGAVSTPAELVTTPDIDTLVAQYEAQLQRWLDQTAQAFGFDNIATAVTYADEPAVPLFQAQGAALRAWRSHLWLAGRLMCAEVKAGTRPVPTEAEVLAAMPQPPDPADPAFVAQ